MSAQDITIAISILTVVSGAINVYVGLRLAALQAKMKADSAALEIALMKQFVDLEGRPASTAERQVRHSQSGRGDSGGHRTRRYRGSTRCWTASSAGARSAGPAGCIFHQPSEAPHE